MKQKKVWLSGSRGFVGSYLTKVLINSGYKVRCLSNINVSDSDILYVNFSSKKDIRDAITKYGVPDTYVHLGWGDVYEPLSSTHLEENLQNGINLIDVFQECGVKRFILVGSSSEYGSRTGLLNEAMGSIGPVNNYVQGKAALANYGFINTEESNMLFIHVRLFYTYGVGQRHNSLINQLFQAFQNQVEMNLSPCEQFRDYIHVLDVAEGIKRICNVAESAIINLGGGKVVQLKSFVEQFWECLGGKKDLLFFGAHANPENEQPQPRAYADLTSLKSMTGWVPSITLDNGIRETVAELLRCSKSKL